MNESTTGRSVPSRDELLDRLRSVGQEHLLAFWDQLDDVQRARLARQIEQIDLNVLRRLQQLYGGEQQIASETTPWAELAQRAESPAAVRLDGAGLPCTIDEARRAGEAALRAGKVGMVFVAGGLGTRLGFEHPKGLFQIGPLSNRSLFEVLLDHVRAVSEHYQTTIPIYLMTSPATDVETREFFEANRYFGLDPSHVVFFCQATMWALDARGQRILLEAPDRLFLGPDGHGGMLGALQGCGALRDMQERGIQHLFYAQIDNPLLQVCDPLLIGSHIRTGSEMTTQVVQKRDPLERVGNVVSIDGRLHMIEYSDLPEEVARQRNADGSLKLWAGNLAVHVFDVPFLLRAVADADVLPYHAARKKVSCLDEQGNLVEPAEPNAIRFERFIFDLLPAAQHALVVEVDPADAFAPVKNHDGEPFDTPTTARQAMMAQARRWLRAAGAKVADDTPVEINHRWALGPDDVRRKLPAGSVIAQPTYFAPDGPRVVEQ